MQGLIGAILTVWQEAVEWFVETIPTLEGLFYSQTEGLTYIGTVSVIALGISIFFLMFGILRKFIRLK